MQKEKEIVEKTEPKAPMPAASEEKPEPKPDTFFRRASMEKLALIRMTPEKKPKPKPIDVKKVRVDEVDKLKTQKRSPKILSPISEKTADEMKNMQLFIDSIGNYQEYRMDDQRALLPTYYAKEEGAKPKASRKNNKPVSPKEVKLGFWSSLKKNKKQVKTKKVELQRGFKANTPTTASQAEFLNIIARYQATRLDDQSADLPSPLLQDEARALPVDDGFDPIKDAQRNKSGDQRATMTGEDIDAIKGDFNKKE